ncbi:MAG: hypothetical protein ACE5PT_06750, partial [Gemmatimonadales bacterium]
EIPGRGRWVVSLHPFPAEARVDVPRIMREGFVAGLIGAGAVAVWFLIVDTIAGRPFFTPAMLGSAVFWGVRDPAAVEIAFPTVVGYTMIHVLAFLVGGAVDAAMASMVESFPSTLFLVVVFFAIFEFGFYLVVAVVARPLLGALAWWAVAAGNLIAAFGMGYFLWRLHPSIRESLALHPLGETMDGE